MKLVGIFLILNAVGLTAWWLATDQTAKGWAMGMCGIAVFAGCILLLGDRITELTVNGVGTIKAASEQVLADAKTVSELKQRVENQSATVDLVAKQAATAKALSEEVEKQNKEATEKLAALDKSTREAKEVLAETRLILEFNQLIVAAQSDDRMAFDKLQTIAEDSTNPFSTRAGQAWRTVFESHASAMSSVGFKLEWNPGVDPSKFTLADLEREYYSAPALHLKQGLLEMISQRADIPKIDRLDLLLRILKSDPSLTAAEYAGRNFTTVAGLQIKPLAVAYLDQWWREHRQDFVGK